MANQKIEINETHSNTKTQISPDGTVEVLYQKMGDRWFAFSLMDDEVFVGSITQEELDGIDTHSVINKNKVHKVAGNS